jgi:uncharacterized membrane protein YfcA
MSPLVGALVVIVGFASGVLSGMFGVGGAVLTTPGIRVLGASPIEAVGSTLPAILPGAVSGSWRYSRAGMVDWHVAIPSGLLGSGFAVAGAELSDHVNAHYLMLVTAALLFYSGVDNVRKQRSHALESVAVSGDVTSAAAEVTRTRGAGSPVVIGAVGASAGLLAGLLGIGGGVLLVPAYTGLLRLPPKRAVATSLVAVAMFSVPATITHTLLGHIAWSYALALVLGVVPGAQLGAHVTLKGSEARLRLLMGLFFTVLALSYGIGELASL